MCNYFLFKETATSEISSLPLPDPLPISPGGVNKRSHADRLFWAAFRPRHVEHGGIRREIAGRNANALAHVEDRKSTRLNSSHVRISYAVLRLKQKTIVQCRLSSRPVPIE